MNRWIRDPDSWKGMDVGMGFRQGWIALLGVLFLFGALESEAGVSRSKGIGLILGEPTGITGKMWISQDRAIDGGIAFSFDQFVFLYSDYLFHFKSFYGIRPYAGIGGGLLISSGNKKGKYFDEKDGGIGLGVRIPLGAEWFVPDAPFGIFAELVPGIGLVPGTYGFFQGGVGARFYLE